MVGKTAIISRLAVSSLIDTLTENDFFNVLYVSNRENICVCHNYVHDKFTAIWLVVRSAVNNYFIKY